jgi:hypothetical protein
MKTRVKQNVFVPSYPGISVHEAYHGIPADDYLQKTKESIDKFVNATQCIYSVRTLREKSGGITKVSTKITENNNIEIDAGGQVFAIHPTKWGIDTVGLLNNKKRFWLFNDDTLDEFDLVCEQKK